MRKPERHERHNTFQGHGGTGFAGPLVAPPWGGSAAGDAGGL
ncbi:MAG: hypothetical protein Q8O85_18380 [Rhodoferax sp.]|nr:hypothetical protein [Rhodoferax sp.]MDP2680668.1 hypothetical protein [Rhodoferax sp.]